MTKPESEIKLDFKTEGSSIDWDKAEREPKKKQKIQGQNLLDLRAMIECLRDQLGLIKTDKFHLDVDIKLLRGELEKAQASNRKNSQEKEKTIRNLNIKSDDLKQQIKKRNNRIEEFATALDLKEEQIVELSTVSKSEISDMRAALNSANEKISELDDNLKSAIGNLNSKEEEISNLNEIIKDLVMEKGKAETELQEFKDLYDLQRDTKIRELRKEIEEKDILIQTQSSDLKEANEQLEILKPPDLDKMGFPSEERITCPICGAVGKDIRSVEDRKKVLYHAGLKTMYSKKNICLKCGYEDF
ncbi:MAG: hypothetical protein ACW986_19525 [Promethearchaeota archaeon]